MFYVSLISCILRFLLACYVFCPFTSYLALLHLTFFFVKTYVCFVSYVIFFWRLMSQVFLRLICLFFLLSYALRLHFSYILRLMFYVSFLSFVLRFLSTLRLRLRSFLRLTFSYFLESCPNFYYD